MSLLVNFKPFKRHNFQLESRFTPKFGIYNTLESSIDPLPLTFNSAVPIKSVYNWPLPTKIVQRLIGVNYNLNSDLSLVIYNNI